MSFIGRTRELALLQEKYEQNNFEFAVIYGRRRIGKTSLINEFVKDKAVIYFTGLEQSLNDNLFRFSEIVNRFENPARPDTRTFENFAQIFEKISQLAQTQKIVLVIDEFPYLAQAYPTISSLLQNFIDHYFKNDQLFLILCGSSMSFMEHQVLGYQSPLYGRRTIQLKLEPFTLSEAQEMFPNMSKQDAFVLNTICGGIPQYLSFMDSQVSLKDNIINQFLDSNGRLFDETNNLLQQELRDPAIYNSVIQAIASGASRLNEIATRVGLTTAAVSSYLSNLIDLGIVAKKVPVTELTKAKSRKTIYQIEDGMFRFYYTFVFPQIDLISRHQSALAYQMVEQRLSDFMGSAFEKYCQEFLWKNVNNPDLIPVPFIHLDNWWGTDSRIRQQVELDILAYNLQDTVGYFGECKWRNEKVSSSVLEKLLDRSSLFNYREKHFFLFSKVGFTDNCIKLAEKSNCQLFTFDQI